MEADEAIYTGTNALAVADTGTGGLLNTGFAGYLRDLPEGKALFRYSDSDRTRYWPRIEFQVLRCEDISPQGTSSATYEVFDTMSRCHVWTRRDTGFNIQDRIVSRLRAVLNRVTPSSFADTDAAARTWYFQPFQRTHAQQAPAGDTELHFVMDFHNVITKGATP